MNKQELFLHFLEKRIMRWTSYSSTPLTIRNFLFHLFQHFIAPFKKRGWFGICDECGQLRRNLESQIIDVDYSYDDPDGPTTLPVRGMVCEECYYRLEEVSYL